MKKPTIKDVARATGVSTATVSFVLNNNRFQTISDATREKVHRAAEMLGYTPSAIERSMKSKSSREVAVVSYFSITEGHFNEVLLAYKRQLGCRKEGVENEKNNFNTYCNDVGNFCHRMQKGNRNSKSC